MMVLPGFRKTSGSHAPVKGSSVLDAGRIKEGMAVFSSVDLKDLPHAMRLNAYLKDIDAYKRRGKKRFNFGDWIRQLSDEHLFSLLECLNTASLVDKDDSDYREQVNELYNIGWYALAAERGKKKIKMDSEKYARHLNVMVDYVGQEAALRRGWIEIKGTVRLLGDVRPRVIPTEQGRQEQPEMMKEIENETSN